jgi:hypothetical protein
MCKNKCNKDIYVALKSHCIHLMSSHNSSSTFSVAKVIIQQKKVLLLPRAAASI